jgi:hypothetical protein
VFDSRELGSREAREARAAELDCAFDVLAARASTHEMLACRRD